jgi:hypothetical protein
MANGRRAIKGTRPGRQRRRYDIGIAQTCGFPYVAGTPWSRGTVRA